MVGNEPLIKLAEEHHEIERCYPVLAELRTQLTLDEFLERISVMQSESYRLAYLEAEGAVQSVAGFRTGTCLARGRFMYVDDLVTKERARGKGHGSALLDWLVDFARADGCRELRLDSGVQRFGAHRFYLVKGMDITCHHFAMMLD